MTISDYKLVPLEPTPEMLSGLVGPNGYTSQPLANAYRAMLAAAPSPEWIKASGRQPTQEDNDPKCSETMRDYNDPPAYGALRLRAWEIRSFNGVAPTADLLDRAAECIEKMARELAEKQYRKHQEWFIKVLGKPASADEFWRLFVPQEYSDLVTKQIDRVPDHE